MPHEPAFSPDDTRMLNEHERRIVRLETKVELLEATNGRLEDELKIYQASALAASRKMDAVLSALVGDETTRTTGIMQRLESIEAVTNFVKELRWKFAGGLIVMGWAMATAYWILEKVFK